MATFQNAKDLWVFITNDIKQGNIKSIYSSDVFFKDLKRSNEELYINGVLIDPILDQARTQIYVATLAVSSICSAVERFNQYPDNIEHACEIIASIPELATDRFESALLNTVGLMQSLPDHFGEAFRRFCAIRGLVLSLQRGVHSQEYREEKYSEIKNELVMASKLKVDISQIETRFLDEAANKIFNQLFEKNQLKSDSQQQYSEATKECLKKFLKLFLHQNFLYPNINLLNKLGEGDYVFNSPNKRTVELSYNDNGLFLQVSFFTQRVFDCNTDELLETQDEDFFVKGVAKYKINIRPYNITGWITKFDLISSSLECKEKFKEILDTRNILEKFQEFIMMCLDKIIAYMTLDQSVSTHKSKFKPIFFVSNSGKSVSKIISEDTETHGNILDLTIENMCYQ